MFLCVGVLYVWGELRPYPDAFGFEGGGGDDYIIILRRWRRRRWWFIVVVRGWGRRWRWRRNVHPSRWCHMNDTTDRSCHVSPMAPGLFVSFEETTLIFEETTLIGRKRVFCPLWRIFFKAVSKSNPSSSTQTAFFPRLPRILVTFHLHTLTTLLPVCVFGEYGE